MQPIPFQIIDWSIIEKTVHPGASGIASWQTLQYPGLRIRIVEYSAGYFANHWCQLSHMVHCLEGAMTTEMKSGEEYILKQGMTYIVTDGMSIHRSSVHERVKLIINLRDSRLNDEVGQGSSSKIFKWKLLNCP